MQDLIIGLQLTVLGIGMVLFILCLLYLAVLALGWAANREVGELLPSFRPRVPEPPPAGPSPEAAQEERDLSEQRKRAAVIAAAVAAKRFARRSRRRGSPFVVPYIK